MKKLVIKNGYKKYPKYEKSNVDWLGDIPAGWKVRKVKHLFKISKEKSFEEDPTILSLTLQGIKVRDISGNEGQLADSYLGYNRIRKNDIVLNPMDLISGFVDCAKTEGVISPAYTTLRSIKPMVHDYYKYYLQWHYYDRILFPFGEGVSVEHRWTLKNEDLMNFPILEPDKESQEKIAKYLDNKIDFIEAIIKKKLLLINLLKERRAVVINNAVTKGLAGNVKLKKSGIEWIGEIPAHWRVIKLKFISKTLIGLTYSPSDIVSSEENGVLVLRASNIKDGKISLNDNVYVKKDFPDKLFTKTGDILICSRSGSRKLIGKNACIDANSSGLTFGVFMTVARSRYWKYLSLVFNSAMFESQSSLFLTSTINQLTAKTLNNLIISLPNEEEQEKIVKYIGGKVKFIDSAISKNKTSINRLINFKLSLIHNTVTGKIKV